MQIESLAQMWERSLRLSADDLAVVSEGRRWTYAQLIERARRLGAFLYAAGARRGSRIAMLAMNCPEWFDYYAACEIHGFVAQTVNFRLTKPEIAYVLEDGEPTVLIFEEAYAEIVAGLREQTPSIREWVCIGDAPAWATPFEEAVAAGDPAGAPLRADPDDLVHMIYTSGSTGKPKGVVRDQRAGAALAAACATSQSMRIGGRMLLTMPMFHIGAQSLASGQHMMGGMVVLHRRFDAAGVARAIEQEGVHITHMAPTLVQQFLAEPRIAEYDLSSLETLCYAAAPMSVPVLRDGLARLGNVFLGCYGSTECGNVAVLQQQFHRPDGSPIEIDRLASVGREHLFSSLRVLDDDGVECPPGVVGELCVQSGSMMRGYWNRSNETAEVLRDGWYHSGDIARMDEDGFVWLVDRKKDMIISGGENIASREVEEALLTHPAIAQAAVIGIPDERWGETVKAVLIARGKAPDPSEVIAHCRTLIAGYKLPRVIEFADELPLLATGKVNKVALRERHLASAQPAVAASGTADATP
jgi:acyl-CoA synthetase (AMP-forming)/AMP-acid ligase II